MKCFLLCVLALLPALISAAPGTVVVNGVCLTCANPNGDPVYINGQEYRSFNSDGNGNSGNVVVSRPGYNNGRSTVYRRGGNTVVNGNCEICNVDV
ncbi:CG5791 [Drosophila busckii]|uniref:CG5791 n=1 Tax=Drosophila busckii TaxID=30019 RepID=A0A0M5J5C6_DROBS|nr:immune-induced peptide 23 [Drosophila busckii]ALC47406.1 CG5791 [Drosophila busckii]